MRPHHLLARFGNARRPPPPAGNGSEPVEGALIVSLNGDDTNPGTYDSPFRTLHAASAAVMAGQGTTVYLRGGVYDTPGVDCYYTSYPGETTGDDLYFFGTEAEPITIKSYPGEWAIIDGHNHSWHPRTFGDGHDQADPNLLRFYGEWVIWEDMEFRHSVGKAVAHFGFDLVLRNLYAHTNHEDCFYGAGARCLFDGCDGHDSYPIATGNNSGDTFKLIRANPASGHWTRHSSEPWFTGEWETIERTEDITYRRCRAWNNCDDGFDTISPHVRTTYEHCIAVNNGYPEQGNGHGIKAGGSVESNTGTIVRFVLAAHNRDWGLITNSSTGCIMYNNVSWRNSRGYDLRSAPSWANDGSDGYNLGFNNVSHDNVLSEASFSSGDGPDAEHHNNNWNLPVEDRDPQFLSLDPDHPDFLKLGPSSPMIDAGANSWTHPVTLATMDWSAEHGAFTGAAPDIGIHQIGWNEAMETLNNIGVVGPSGPLNPLGARVMDTSQQGGTPPTYE